MISAKSLTALACALLLVLAAATPAQATPPTRISYQGRLTDASGNPANGTGNITFKIYHEAAAGSGTSVWDETQTSVSVSSGIFQVELGSVTALGGGSENLTTLFASDTYLEVVIVDGANFGLTGGSITLPSSGNRPQLLATPYTFRATLAEGLTTDATLSIASLTTSGIVTSGGNFTVGSNKFTVSAADGNTSIAGTLGVTGATATAAITASGVITANAGISVPNGQTLTVAAGGTLDASAGTLSVGALSPTSLIVTGSAALDGGITVDTDKFMVAGDNSGNTSIAGTLGVTGATTLSAATSVSLTDNTNPALTVAQSGTGDLLLVKDGGSNVLRVQDGGATGITGNTTITGTLGVSGAAALSSTLGVTGDVAVNTDKFTVTAASGNASIGGTLTSTGLITGNAGLTVTGGVGSVTSGDAVTLTLNTSGARTANGALLEVKNENATKFSVDAEGDVSATNVAAGGTLTVAATATAAGLITANGGITVPSGQVLTVPVPATGLSLGGSLASANVTGENLSTLTGAGNADALHTHATVTPGDNTVTTEKITNATILGEDLAANIVISTTGNISTTSSGTITSDGLLTASAGATVAGIATVNQASDAIGVDVNKTGTGVGSAVDINNAGTGNSLQVTSTTGKLLVLTSGTDKVTVAADGNTTFAGSVDFTGGWSVSGTPITADAAELNKLDGLTATQVNLNSVTGALGSAAFLAVGTGADNVVQLDGSAKLPAVDGSLLTGVVATTIADNAVTSAKIAANTIVAADIAAGTVTGTELAASIGISTTGNISTTSSGTITSAGLLTAGNGLTVVGALTLPDNAVALGKVADDAITAAEIATSAVTTDEILDGTIAGGDLNAAIVVSTTGSVTVDNIVINSDLITKDNGALAISTTTAGAITATSAAGMTFTAANNNNIAFTTSGSGVVTMASGLTVSSGTLTAGTVDINGGAIDGTAIGGTAASTGAFTTLSVTPSTAVTAMTVTQNTAAQNGLVINHAGTASADAINMIEVTLTGASTTGSGTIFLVNGNGDVRADGTIYSPQALGTGSADLSEVFSANGPELEPGDVVVIDTSSPETMTMSTKPNDPLVAGIVSTKPGVRLNADAEGYDIALAGRVPTKASDENGPIGIGDLMVTSSTPGHAMKAPENPKLGTVVGKALEALPAGAGKIMVLVTLQ